MKFSVLAGIIAIFVFAAVAFALALYAFLKIHSDHECHYSCTESNKLICAYKTEEQMKNHTGGMNFSSICHRDMYNCQNPAHSFNFYEKISCPSVSVSNDVKEDQEANFTPL
ncbi:hypothetical protein PVAND_013601 [Polypedilum vanderplanki]|uniref:Uncharacterized protein n=1 Tax=Polypedilum vanderplanki TaxID=319348 RepID=A0A9J6CRW4_POLVA|nr:hypothetical protein PVAND_013601 [Polypedilum vanderplanki]